MNYTLERLEEQLEADLFFLANRQLIVHMDAVKEVRPYFKGCLYLLLKPDAEAEMIIRSSKAPAFKAWLDL